MSANEKLKRKAGCRNDNSSSRKKRQKRSGELSAYFKSYKNGLDDWHLPLFRAVHEYMICHQKGTAKVLYPGCYRHITPSLVFNNIVYIDFDSKISKFFDDEAVKDWVREQKGYDRDASIKFECLNFSSLETIFEVESFDLLISACAGFVTPSTSSLLKNGGYCLVSDAHFDARMLSLDKNFTLVSVWDKKDEKFVFDADVLSQHFITENEKPLTRAMVDESVAKPKTRRSFKLKKEAMFYLFTKNSRS